jgi:hypothetical protein
MTVATSRHNRILGNAIYDSDGLGIDLGTTGRTPNNPRAPPTGETHSELSRHRQRQSPGYDTGVGWMFDSLTSRTYRLAVLGAPCDTSRYGEGRTRGGAVARDDRQTRAPCT